MTTLSHSPLLSCAHAALSYAQEEGLPVFPLNGKVPFPGSKGFYDATTDPATILEWWKRWPWANVGIPTGKRSGWIVLDIDARHGGFDSLGCVIEQAAQSSGGHLAMGQSSAHFPLTCTARTGGGGLHMIFAWPSDLAVPLKNAVALGGYSGVDLRGEGGYVVVAPSRHASGGCYEWLWREPVAPMPRLLLDLCMPRPALPANRHPSTTTPTGMGGGGVGPRQKHWSADAYLEMALRKAQVGSRHRYALFLACRLVRDAGLSLAEAESYLRVYASRVPSGDHPYGEQEALRCLRWALTHV